MRVFLTGDGTKQPQPPPPSNQNTSSSSSSSSSRDGRNCWDDNNNQPPRKKVKGSSPFQAEEEEEGMGGGGRLAAAGGPAPAPALKEGSDVEGENHPPPLPGPRRGVAGEQDEGPRPAVAAAASSPHRSTISRPRARGRNPEDEDEDDDEWQDNRTSSSSSRCIFLGKSNDEDERNSGSFGQGERSHNASSSRRYYKSSQSGASSSSSSSPSMMQPLSSAPAPLLNGPVPGSEDDPATMARTDAVFERKDTDDDEIHDQEDEEDVVFTPLSRFVHLLCSKHKPPLDVVEMDGDGNCLFRAISLQVYGDASMHSEVRRRVLDFMANDEGHWGAFVADEDFAEYVARKREDGVHGNHTEIQAASELYCRSAEVYVPAHGIAPINIFHSEYAGLGDAPIRLCYTDGNHYDAVVDPLVPTAGLGLGLPGLQPGLADKMQMEEAKKMSDRSAVEEEGMRAALEESERARKVREEEEVREALRKSTGEMMVKTPAAGDCDDDMYKKKAMYLSEIEAADFDLEQAVLASSLESYRQAEQERKPSSSRRGDRRSRFNTSPRGLRSSSNSPVHRTAAAAPAAASLCSNQYAAAAAASAASASAASLSGASSQMAAGRNNSASITTDEYPASVQELVMNGFELSKVLHAYDLIGDNFDDLLSFLLSSAT